MTWLYLHGKADSKPLKAPYDHTFIKLAHADSKPFLILRIAKPNDFKNLKPSVGAWLDVRLGGENQLVVSTSELLTTGPVTGKPIEIATREDCKSAGLFELTEFAEFLKSRPTILNLISRRPGLSNKILEIWGKDKLLSTENVAIQSESDGTLKELREAEARGFYGSSQATLIQMEVLSNIGLAGLMDLKSDMLVSSTEEMQHGGKFVPRIRPATLLEAHRRGMKRYAGPTRSKESAQELFKLGYDGVLIESPKPGAETGSETGSETLAEILEAF